MKKKDFAKLAAQVHKTSIPQLSPLPFLLTLVFGLSFLLSSLSIKPASQLNQLLLKTSQKPEDAKAHLTLAQAYIILNQKGLAATELALGKQETNVLGQSTAEIDQLESQLVHQPHLYAAKKKYWEKVVVEKPYVRDAWVQLLFLGFNQRDITSAQGYLNKIKELDPNYIENLPQELLHLQN